MLTGGNKSNSLPFVVATYVVLSCTFVELYGVGEVVHGPHVVAEVLKYEASRLVHEPIIVNSLEDSLIGVQRILEPSETV